MGKLKKFWSNKQILNNLCFYPYEIKMPLTDLPISMIGRKFYISEEFVTFRTNKRGLAILRTTANFEHYEIRNLGMFRIRHLFVERWLTLMSLTIIMFIFLVSNNYIREVAFVNQKDYSVDVYEYVLDNLEKKGPFYTLKKSINEISIEMRYRFPYYAWIGLSKKGSKLLIEIDKQTETEIINDDKTPGHLVASKDGYILSYNVERGIVLINQFSTVKAGQRLVDGNFNYYHENEPAVYLHAKGEILARTVELETINVSKETTDIVYTGRFTSHFIINKGIFKHRKPFEVFIKKEQVIFKLGSFFRLVKVSYYQQQEVKSCFDELSAGKYATSLIEKNFHLQKRSNKEKILSQDIIEIIEEDNHYQIKVLVVRCENIASFLKINQE